MKRLAFLLCILALCSCASLDERYGLTGGPFRIKIIADRLAEADVPWPYQLWLKGQLPQQGYFRFQEAINGHVVTQSEGPLNPTRRVYERHMLFPAELYYRLRRQGATPDKTQLPPITDDVTWDGSVDLRVSVQQWVTKPTEHWRTVAADNYELRLGCMRCGI